MTREEELASLLSEIGLERGVAIEQLVDDLARLRLPSFIDDRAFRAALLNALEYQLRAQLETTISDLRRRFGAGPGVISALPTKQGEISLPPNPRLEPTRAQPVSLPQGPTNRPIEPPAQTAEPDLPDDATIHWEPEQGPTRR